MRSFRLNKYRDIFFDHDFWREIAQTLNKDWNTLVRMFWALVFAASILWKAVYLAVRNAKYKCTLGLKVWSNLLLFVEISQGQNPVIPIGINVLGSFEMGRKCSLCRFSFAMRIFCIDQMKLLATQVTFAWAVLYYCSLMWPHQSFARKFFRIPIQDILGPFFPTSVCNFFFPHSFSSWSHKLPYWPTESGLVWK